MTMHPLDVKERQFLQSQRITLAHRLKVAWAHDENFYFALSQTRWGQKLLPDHPRLREYPTRSRSFPSFLLNQGALD